MYNRLYTQPCIVYCTCMPRIENKLTIRNHIQELRNEKNLTQEDLANAVDVTRATILAIEKGNYNPSLELAFRLARFFKKEIGDVFYE
jgi:putative transcriptional regulator